MNFWLAWSRHALRNMRRGGLPFFFAICVIALGLCAGILFWQVLTHFQTLSERAQGSVGGVAFLSVTGGAEAEEVRARIARLPGVAQATLVTPEAALGRVRHQLGKGGVWLDGLDGLDLGFGVEIAPDLRQTLEADALEREVRALTGVEDYLHPGGELRQVQAWVQVLEQGALVLGALIAFVTLFVVSMSVRLTLHARREDIAILKLVGATDTFVRMPFLLEGVFQGLFGSALALLAATGAHASLASLLQVVLRESLGGFMLEPLTSGDQLRVLIAGASLGLFGALVSVGRYLRV